MAMSKDQLLAQGYQDWWNQNQAAWTDLLAANVKVFDENGSQVASNKVDAITVLTQARVDTAMVPTSVEVFTSADGKVSLGSDRERMLSPAHRRSKSHICVDRFEWNNANPPKIVAIYICIADSAH